MANESEWTNRVAAWRDSGQSAAEFCADKDYSASTLYYRASQLKRRSGSSGEAARVSIARVVRKSAAPEPTTAPIVVQIGLARVEIAAGVDGATLSEVLRALTRGTGGEHP